MSGGWLAAVAFLLVPAPPATVPSCRTGSPALERLIAEKARSLSMTESCQFRRYDALDDVDGDGKDDLVLIFTLEGPDGADDHVSFLAAFLSGSPDRPLVLEAGRRGERDPVAIESKRGEIALETLEFLPKDPTCCPSGKGKSVYRLHAGKLSLVRRGAIPGGTPEKGSP